MLHLFAEHFNHLMAGVMHTNSFFFFKKKYMHLYMHNAYALCICISNEWIIASKQNKTRNARPTVVIQC